MELCCGLKRHKLFQLLYIEEHESRCIAFFFLAQQFKSVFLIERYGREVGIYCDEAESGATLFVIQEIFYHIHQLRSDILISVVD